MKTLFTIFTLFLFFMFQNAYAAEVLSFKAQYKIPTIDQSEESYSVYSLLNYQVTTFSAEENKKAQLNYTLPQEMIGTETNVAMELVSNIDGKTLEGELASAKCVGPWKQMKCEMRFHHLNIDLAKIEEQLILNGASSDEINLRLQVLKRFSGDPIGFSETLTGL